MDKEGINRVKEFLSAKHYISRQTVNELKSNDIETFRQIAAGAVAGISRGDRLKALQVVSQLGSPQDCGILGQVIGKEKEDISLRAAAAVNMAYLKPELAENDLIRYLEVQDDLVRSKVIKSLGMIGGTGAYKALSELENVQIDFVQKQLTFARALIAYRHNLDADPLPFIEGAERQRGLQDELLQLTVKPIRTPKIVAAMKRFEGSTYGIELSESTGFEVIVGKAKWMLFINKRSAEEGIIKSINSRKMIMGLLSRWIRETDTYNVQYVVLTKPTEDNQVQIMVVRSDGELFYSGKATVKGNIMSFMISDIKRPGTAPTKVRGKLTLGGIELDVSVPVSKRENKRLPRTIDPEEFYSRFSGN